MLAAWVIILLLTYSIATQYSVSSVIDRLVAENADDNHFTDQDSLLTFMRVGVVLWTFLVSFLQALILRLIYRAIMRAQGPRLIISWYWLLLGQIPFMMIVFGFMAFGNRDAAGVLGAAGIRIAFGAVSALIYCLLAHVAFKHSILRLSVFFALVTLVNSVLLVAAPTA